MMDEKRLRARIAGDDEDLVAEVADRHIEAAVQGRTERLLKDFLSVPPPKNKDDDHG